ncbi:hypothetical protein [Cerasicoccus frondis]|uniref:hypothetical protein n=1 Tax=Cerasicoccus frondis TaxID=490090 RepID=UPI002852D6F4|nr:hypothetical protein [Cerasicoccus frondis]
MKWQLTNGKLFAQRKCAMGRKGKVDTNDTDDKSQESAGAATDLDHFDTSCLSGRTASEPEIIRWVANNIDNPLACPENCPSPFAWTLLKDCRVSMETRFFFMEKLWAKLIPARSTFNEDDDKREEDGAEIVGVIDRIRAARDSAIDAVIDRRQN